MKHFFTTLIDSSFKTYVTRQVAGVLYLISLVFIGLGATASVIAGLLSITQGLVLGGVLLAVGGPLVGVLLLILIRLVFESSVALVAIAENTGK